MFKNSMASAMAMALACALTLSACGGGGSGSPTQPAAPQPKTVLIEAYGDSTMWGCTLTQGAPAGSKCVTIGYAQTAKPVPEQVQTFLQAKYGPTVTVVNHGVPGDLTPFLLSGDGFNLPWAQQMAQSKADIVYLNYGINDANATSGESASDFQANLNQIISIAKAAGKTVVLETANPVNDPTGAHDALPQFVAAELITAQQWDVTVIDQFNYLSGMANWDSLLSDPLHPTQDGYNLKAKFEFQALDPIVGFALAH
jgi:lysophospholipase L1-like esterase